MDHISYSVAMPSFLQRVRSHTDDEHIPFGQWTYFREGVIISSEEAARLMPPVAGDDEVLDPGLYTVQQHLGSEPGDVVASPRAQTWADHSSVAEARAFAATVHTSQSVARDASAKRNSEATTNNIM